MINKTIYVPVGLPGSGKTSWIRKMRATSTERSVVISGDQIRLMLRLGEYHYSDDDTKKIVNTMLYMSKVFLETYDVVFLDEFYISHQVDVRRKLVTFYESCADVKFVNMKRDLGACIHRRCTDDREPDTSRWPNVLLKLSGTFEPYEEQS